MRLVNLACAPLNGMGAYDCVVFTTDYTGYDCARIARGVQLQIDTRNAARKMESSNIARCQDFACINFSNPNPAHSRNLHTALIIDGTQ